MAAPSKPLEIVSVASVAVLLAFAVVGSAWTTPDAAPSPRAEGRAAPSASSIAETIYGTRSTDGSAPGADADSAPPALRYDKEYPWLHYEETPPQDAIAKLAARIASGDARLAYEPKRGYLDSLLENLEIDPASQTLVFSRTSLQSRRIKPETPRAIYFNDDVYVAFVQDGPLEIASTDPKLGVVYYLLEQSVSPKTFERENQRCLACHDSYSLSGGGVPRFIVGSGYTGPAGQLVSHEGWILVTDKTPLKSRWGGWYVTGRHGDQVHLGNMIIRSYDDFPKLDSLRVGNLDDLDGLFDTTPYPTDKSDIVALLVLEHQVNAQNAIVRLAFDTRAALYDEAHPGAPAPAPAAVDGEPRGTPQERIAAAVEPLLQTFLFSGQIEYTAPIVGLPQFQRQFEGRAVRDAQGRSLRDFDLHKHLFKYPLSYEIYSAAFEALPDEAKSVVYRRLGEILRGEDRSEPFAELTADDRAAILEILRDTKPDFARSLAR
jgi:hypothetical protein